MKQFETFDPSAWVDGVLLDAPPVSPSLHDGPTVRGSLADAGQVFLRKWVVGPVVAAGVAAAVLCGAPAGTNWSFDARPESVSAMASSVHTGDQPTAESASQDGAWKRALQKLAASGEDVGALLAQAAGRLSAWKGREAPFPSKELLESERDFDAT